MPRLPTKTELLQQSLMSRVQPNVHAVTESVNPNAVEIHVGQNAYGNPDATAFKFRLHGGADTILIGGAKKVMHHRRI